jgi:acetolactate synthase-1/2/3 large subunit
MNTKSSSQNGNRAKQIESQNSIEIAPVPGVATRDPIVSLDDSDGSSIFSPAKPSRLHSSGTNIQPNSQSILSSDSTQPSTSLTVAEAVVKMLEDLGVNYAFGVSGGAIAPIWATLERSSLDVLHFRHESGASFAATESYFANGRPVVVFTTTGPGITNALTGLLAARWEGAKVILLSASTAAAKRGRWACQETSLYTMPISGVFTPGPLFDYATTLEGGDDLPEIARRLALGLAQPGGFVAHISVPTAIQTSLINAALPSVMLSRSLATVDETTISTCVRLLSEGPFAIWVGFGARHAAAEISQLAERTGAAVMCSPRGKGIFPEDHPQFIGVTGVGGHASVLTYMQEQRPLHTLVLGTRLGEATSFWSPLMVPTRGFIHIDIDPQVPGVAYPTAATVAIQSDVGLFLRALLQHFPENSGQSMSLLLPRPEREESKLGTDKLGTDKPVCPAVLMSAIQRIIVEGSDAIVMTESGNSLAWGNHVLRFTQPDRYRVSTGFGAMGHFVTGVIGAALGRNGKAVAIIGDGAMLMNSEVNTAVKFQIPAVWIVLNDGRYNMCKQGMALLGFKGIDAEIPPANFVMIARGMGADGIRVETESDIEAALRKALASPTPFVVDVVINPDQPAPIGGRIKSLISQGATESK